MPTAARFSSGGKVSHLRRHPWPESSTAAGHQSVALSLMASPTRAAFVQATLTSEQGAPSFQSHQTLQILVHTSIEGWGNPARSAFPSPRNSPGLCQESFLTTWSLSLSHDCAMQTPPHSPPPDVEWRGDLRVTCPFGTPDLSAASLLPPGPGNHTESGLLGLGPKDFPDPHRQKQRRFLCFAFAYSRFMIMLLSVFKRLRSFTGLC